MKTLLLILLSACPVVAMAQAPDPDEVLGREGGVTVAAAALGIMPISVSAIVGLGLMLATGCLNWRDAASAA